MDRSADRLLPRGTPRDPKAMIELALFYRDQCLEWAAVASIPVDLQKIAEDHAALWQGVAANVARDAKLIADSRALVAEAEKLL